MSENNMDIQIVNESELMIEEIEVEELEQRLEMSCTRCCISAN
ncbi:hypothetical protein tloyanaT_24940 [Thalassotalea loyana]|uniref:Uncharacterized protein n=1 Tax=Thalassotalea loyana TaxID=280483 RepID=A0ABQ6HI38_9GAMM|nr:hypothetical protein [Thalassotalea loyana]GLX86241.1 hypothetical protein tloyanaT_24940 [Thalassotalea loyana]